MSYNNNWLRSLSESYVNNNRPSDLQEELNEQVYLNENLLEIIEALCEELGIDMQELLQLDEAKAIEQLSKAKSSNKQAHATYKAWAERNPEQRYDNFHLYFKSHNKKRAKLGLSPMKVPPAMRDPYGR